MTTVTIIATLAIAGWIHDAEQGGYANALMNGGLAVTFTVLWLRHARDWVKVAIVALEVLAIVSLFLANP